MGIYQTKLYPVVTALLLTIGNPSQALAQTAVTPPDTPSVSDAPVSALVAQQERLRDMLQELRTAPPAEAIRLTREIEREWAKSGSTSIDMVFRRGREAMEEEQIDLAIGHLTAVIDHAPDFAEGWNARATAYFIKGLYGPALSDLQQALILNPENYNALFGLGIMFQEFGDNQRAERAFRRVIEINPNHENAGTMLERLKSEGIGREL